MLLSKNIWLLIIIQVSLLGCASTEKKPPRLEKLISPTTEINVFWKAKVGVSGNYRFVPAVDEKAVCAAGQHGKINCFDLKSGKIIQQNQMSLNFSGGVGITEQYLLLGTVNGEILAISRSDGDIEWRRMMSSQILGPAKSGGEIIVVRTGNGNIYGLSKATGDLLWRYQTNQPALILRANPSVAVDAEQNVAAGLTDGRLVFIDGVSGVLKWEVVVAQTSGTNELERISDIAGTPYMDNKMVCAIAYNGNVACYEKNSGKKIWSREASSSSNLAADGTNIYYTDDSDVVIALEKLSGANLWKQGRLKGRNLTAPLEYKDWLIVGDSEGFIHVLLKSDGSLVGRVFLDKSGIKEPPLASQGYVFAQTMGGGIYSLSVTPK